MWMRLAGVLALCLLAFCVLRVGVANAQTSSGRLGIFDAETDLGVVTPPGTAKYDAGTRLRSCRSRGEHLVQHRCISLRVEEGLGRYFR